MYPRIGGGWGMEKLSMLNKILGIWLVEGRWGAVPWCFVVGKDYEWISGFDLL